MKQYLYDSSRKKSKDNPLSTRIWCFALVECLAFERRMVDVPPIPFSSCYVSGHALSLCSTSSEIPAGWFNLSNAMVVYTRPLDRAFFKSGKILNKSNRQHLTANIFESGPILTP